MSEKGGFSCRLGTVSKSAVTLKQSSGVVNIPLDQIASVTIIRDRSLYLKSSIALGATLALVLLLWALGGGPVPWLITLGTGLAVIALALIFINRLGDHALVIESEKGKNKLALRKKGLRMGEMFATAISTAYEEMAPPDWGFLRNLDELAHYSTIVGYVNHFKPNASVLDVGCGDGLLQEKLKIAGYENYLGFDLDERLIATAADKQSEDTRFEVNNIETFTTNSHYDAIVFNEVLYYSEDPVVTFNKFSKFLHPGGVIIISMFQDPQSRETWQLVDAEYEAVDSVTITNSKGTGWDVKCYQPG